MAILMALILLCLAPCAQAGHYGWAFMIYDLGLSIEIGNSFMRTDDETLEQTNSFERSGNVKPDLILEVYDSQTRSQLFVYCAAGSPYDNLEELTLAYAEDLGAVSDGLDANGTAWSILRGEEFMGMPCTRILSTLQNVNAEYILMLSDDHSAYIITMVTFDGKAPDSSLEGVTFNHYAQPTAQPEGEAAQPEGEPAAQPTADVTGQAAAQPTQQPGATGLMGAAAGK